MQATTTAEPVAIGAELIGRKVGFYASTTDNRGGVVPLSEVLYGISSGRWGKQVNAVRKLREEKGEDAADELKKRTLQAFTSSGVFKPTRSKANLAASAALLIIDIDDIAEDVSSARGDFEDDPYVLAAFISPSGHGIKLIVFVGTLADDAEFKAAWRAFAVYLKQKWGYLACDSGKDISRLCYVSFDPGVHIKTGEVRAFTERTEIKRELPKCHSDTSGTEEAATSDKALPDWMRKVNEMPAPDSEKSAPDAPPVENIRAALCHLDPGVEYDKWLRIAMALKSVYPGKEGFALFDEWSKRAPDRYGGTAETWNSIKPEGGVTVGTLYAAAEGAGWVNPVGKLYAEIKRLRATEANGATEDRTRGGALVDTYPPMRFGQLQALKVDPDANYIAGNGFIRRGAWSLFTGGTGIGKSVAVEQTAACLACGKDVFGLKVARPFKVLLLTAENDEETLKRDLEAIAEHEGLDPELLDANLQIHHAYALDGRELVDALQSEMVRGGFDMAILDNYQAFSGDDINGSKEWKAFITPLAKMLKELRAAMLLVDHTGKPTERKGWGVNDSVYMAAGTSRKSNGARTSIELYSPTDGDTRYRLHFGKCWERTGIYDEYGHMVRDVYLDRSPSANHPYWTPSEDQSPPMMGGGGKPVVELPDDEAVALLGGVAFSKEQTRTKLRAAGVSRDGATDHIRRLLVSGKLVSWSPSIPHPPTYVGTPEAIEKIKAEMAERAQGKLALGGQTSQTSQTSRRKSGKSRRP